jgi:hypothetical protein
VGSGLRRKSWRLARGLDNRTGAADLKRS